MGYMPVLELHPFFHEYVKRCPQVMRKVCHTSMSSLLVSAGDVIFNCGEKPSHPAMYIICSGAFEYIPIHGEVTKREQEHWLSEHVLWVQWVHHGVLKASTD